MTTIKRNLKIDGDKVISYKTHVATICTGDKLLKVHGTWSQTTTGHITTVANQLGLTKVFQPNA